MTLAERSPDVAATPVGDVAGTGIGDVAGTGSGAGGSGGLWAVHTEPARSATHCRKGYPPLREEQMPHVALSAVVAVKLTYERDGRRLVLAERQDR